MVSKVEGKLDVQVVAGRELPRRSLFGRRDSAVELMLGTVNKRTQVDKKGGSSPQWNDRVSFTVSGLGKSQLHVTAIEIESAVSHKVIGSCVIDLTRIFVEEEHNDKPAGDVYLEFTFTPKGGRKNIRKDPLANEEDNPLFQSAPKPQHANDTVASAPSLLQDPTTRLDARPNSIAHPVSAVAPIAMRPSVSDMRPYSSASMHNPDLAIKYANKHGTKPLPAAPQVSGSAPMTMAMADPAMTMAVGQSPMMGYDQTILPGQASYINQQQLQQQQQSFQQSIPVPMQSGAMVSAISTQQMQQQEPALMNLFAPPTYADDASAMAQPVVYTQACNPAYVSSDVDQPMMQQMMVPAKNLPLPPGQLTGTPQMINGQLVMVVDPAVSIASNPQPQIISPPYTANNDYQMDPMQQVIPAGYSYAQVPAGSVPDIAGAYQHYPMPQHEIYQSQVFVQPQLQQQQQQQQQPMVTFVGGGYQPGHQIVYDQPPQIIYVTQAPAGAEPSAPIMNFDGSQSQYIHQSQPQQLQPQQLQPQQYHHQYVNAPGNFYGH
ncbi:hypothetical protein LPJ64_000240 [Coemansia asiatica]|uniref:C2 domain-containing protein n=1 Tax=Coemansia asiatica TaxID=1052880 RepID=A0A9W7XT26_9FUNG|nr:hypothetical protein LPJ64_000240 [Coemansia asiatica]